MHSLAQSTVILLIKQSLIHCYWTGGKYAWVAANQKKNTKKYLFANNIIIIIIDWYPKEGQLFKQEGWSNAPWGKNSQLRIGIRVLGVSAVE